MKSLLPLRALGAALTLALVAGGASAQQTGGNREFTPSVGQPGKDVIWVPSPDRVVDRMLRMAEVKPTDVVVDLGSGDGKIAIAAARLGAKAQGLEYNPDMVTLSQRRAREAGVADKVEFRQADIFASNFNHATVLTMYLLPSLNLKLRPIIYKMKPGTRVTSHSFDMGNWAPDETSIAGSSRAYLWIVPANVSGDWRVTAPAAVGAPATFSIRQRYQKIEGEAAFSNGEIDASLQGATVRGDDVRFVVRDAQGRLQTYQGKADGNKLTGTVTVAGQAPVRFEATRSAAPQPIDEAPNT